MTSRDAPTRRPPTEAEIAAQVAATIVAEMVKFLHVEPIESFWSPHPCYSPPPSPPWRGIEGFWEEHPRTRPPGGPRRTEQRHPLSEGS